jgi:AcrR family transcriptional regulator
VARPLSETKRVAIIDAAVVLFAARGVWSTPTSAISAAAHVAEGTLFTYFPSKDLLVNEIYRGLKLELADTLLTAYPKAADARVRFRHIWDRYVHWGVSHPDKYRVLAQLQTSESISEESRAVGSGAFKEIERLAKDSIRKKRILNRPLSFLAALMTAMGDATVGFVAQNKNSRMDYTSAGFEIFWTGIALH